MVRRLASRPAPSTTRAGVVRSAVFIAGRLMGLDRRGRPPGGTLRGDEPALVGRCLRPGRCLPCQGALPARSPRCLHRRHRILPAQRLQPYGLRQGTRGRPHGRRDVAVRWRSLRGEGARTGRGLALYGSLGDLQGSLRGRGRHIRVPSAHFGGGAGRADDGARVRWDQLHLDRTARDDAEPVEPGAHARRVVGWYGGRCCGRAASHRHRQRWRRLHPRTGRMERPVRPEGNLRPDSEGPESQHRADDHCSRLPHPVGSRHGPVLRRL